MIKKHTVFVGILCGAASFLGIVPLAQADTPLTHASIEELRNQVDFIPSGESARFAQLSDRLHPGDALSTYQEAFAELEFNDGSLARVGELALFRFQPNTRTFELDNGTMLLLIPPERGTSRLRTPNATAGIRGSALFVRHIPGKTLDRTITLVGALTTSGIEVSNSPHSLANKSADETTLEATTVELEAGQMAVIVGNEAPQVLTFDLELFGQTSSLASGLNLYGNDRSASIWQGVEHNASPLTESGGRQLGEDEQEDGQEDGQSESSVPDADPNDPIDLVRQEITDGLLSQTGTLTGPYFDNPAFIYGGDWQSGSALLPSSQPERTQGESEYDDTIDSIIDAVDIQTLQPSDVVNPTVPIPPPDVLGPMPGMGPNPTQPSDPPSPPVFVPEMPPPNSGVLPTPDPDSGVDDIPGMGTPDVDNGGQDLLPPDDVDGPGPGNDSDIDGPGPGNDNDVDGPGPGNDNDVDGPGSGNDNDVDRPEPDDDNDVDGPGPGNDNDVDGPGSGNDNDVDRPEPDDDNDVDGPGPDDDNDLDGPGPDDDNEPPESNDDPFSDRPGFRDEDDNDVEEDPPNSSPSLPIEGGFNPVRED